MYASYNPLSMQGEKHINPNLLYNLLCVLKPLVDYGFYTPWNDKEKEDVRRQREENNNKITEYLVEFTKYKGTLHEKFNINYKTILHYFGRLKSQ